VLKKMDYFQVGWHQDAELVALAFGAFAADQLVACSLDVVALGHLWLNQLQLVKTVLMVKMKLEYLMTLVIENQVANQPKLLQRFQL
jgi:hypothetical protein